MSFCILLEKCIFFVFVHICLVLLYYILHLTLSDYYFLPAFQLYLIWSDKLTKDVVLVLWPLGCHKKTLKSIHFYHFLPRIPPKQLEIRRILEIFCEFQTLRIQMKSLKQKNLIIRRTLM